MTTGGNEHKGKETPELRSRFLGCFFGQAVADAVCAPFEGVPAVAIWYDFGGASKIVADPPVSELQYTDDTQMCLALAEELVEHGRLDDGSLARRYADHYEPERGYGPGARRILDMIRSGGDWRALRTGIFPGGSLGNGAAMRAAPVGLLFHHDRSLMIEQADHSALPTHVHPVGIDGARVVAAAVSHVLRVPTFTRDAFYDDLLDVVSTDTFRERLNEARRMGPDDSIARLGNSLEADQSVVTAVASFAWNPNSYPAVVVQALTLGGDVDTIAAMAGAISGAFLGAGAIPARLLGRLENGRRGREYIEQLAHGLFNRFVSSCS